jgi:hypothetical protein
MNNKEKLMCLLMASGISDMSREKAEVIAEYLVKNNTMVLPCAIGSQVWVISKSCAEPFSAKFRLDDIDQFGKRVFLTRAEALRRMRGAKR